MRKVYFILFIVMLSCLGCQWHLKNHREGDLLGKVTVDRYDRVQTLYLTTGDFSALQQLKTVYPAETRTLIEDVLHLGQVNDPQINAKFLSFYQDSTLQCLIADVEKQYDDMEDINHALSESFKHLLTLLPDFEIPKVYAQIGSLDQSVIVSKNRVGICLDKYLGSDYALYRNPAYGYSSGQRKMMQRSYIVPDCLGYYLLSLYPIPQESMSSQMDNDQHMGKIQWVVNKVMNREVFQSNTVKNIDRYMNSHKDMSVDLLLKSNYLPMSLDSI